MVFRNRSGFRKALWIAVPALVLLIASIPRALAWGRHHARPSSPDELSEHMEHGLEHLLDKVDATDAQQAQAAALADRRAPELFALMAEGRKLKQQAKQVLLAEQLDKAKLAELRGKLDAVYARTADATLGGFFELAELLTPAQRKQVAERLARFED